jgi:competence protein ComEA
MLNLARRVTDGEQILVGLPQPPVAPGPPAAGAGSRVAGGKVDLNRATLEQLDTLPGIGPVTAQRILDWRTKHGRFTSVEQLREVEGIGERRFGQLRTQVTL